MRRGESKSKNENKSCMRKSKLKLTYSKSRRSKCKSELTYSKSRRSKGKMRSQCKSKIRIPRVVRVRVRTRARAG